MARSEELVPGFDPELLQARWVLGGISADALVSEALSALQRGFSGMALQQLAGLTTPTLTDLGTLSERAFADLGLKPVNREQAVDFLVARGEPSSGDTIWSLMKAFPAFSERWRHHIDYWGGHPAGIYNDMAEFVHFVVEDLYEEGKLDDVRGVFQFMEQLVARGDQETRDVIGLGFLETLQNVSSWQPYGCKAFERFLGPTSEQIWREIQKMWVGKSSLADVIRAEREHD